MASSMLDSNSSGSLALVNHGGYFFDLPNPAAFFGFFDQNRQFHSPPRFKNFLALDVHVPLGMVARPQLKTAYS